MDGRWCWEPRSVRVPNAAELDRAKMENTSRGFATLESSRLPGASASQVGKAGLGGGAKAHPEPRPRDQDLSFPQDREWNVDLSAQTAPASARRGRHSPETRSRSTCPCVQTRRCSF